MVHLRFKAYCRAVHLQHTKTNQDTTFFFFIINKSTSDAYPEASQTKAQHRHGHSLGHCIFISTTNKRCGLGVSFGPVSSARIYNLFDVDTILSIHFLKAIQTYTHTHMHTHTYIHNILHTCIHTHSHPSSDWYLYACIRRYIHMCIHIYSYARLSKSYVRTYIFHSASEHT